MRGRSKDQDLIDELAAWMQAPDPETVHTNGHATPTTPGSSGPTDEMVIQKCRSARNAAKFADLYDSGDLSGYGGDDSRADLALARLIAFYSQDPIQVERLISGSALGGREKWVGRADYRRRTVEKALKQITETYDWPRDGGVGFDSSTYRDKGVDETNILPFKSARQAAREAPAEVEWLARPYVAKGAITEIDGKIKAAGKTTFISHLCACVAAGRPFMGVRTTKTKVVWLTEQSPASFRVVLERSGLAESDDVQILYWQASAGHPSTAA